MAEMTMFPQLSDEAVEAILDRTADAILTVHAMTPEQRATGTEKGNSPNAMVSILIHVFSGAALELEARGRLPKGWLEADD